MEYKSHLYSSFSLEKKKKTTTKDVLEALNDGMDMSISAHTVLECNKKLEGKNLLLDNPESRLKKGRKGDFKKRFSNSKERKAMDKEILSLITYDSMIPLHMLWLEYMRDIISTTTNQNLLLNSLLRADYHGSILQIIQSKSPNYVGLQGIVCKENMNTFFIVTVNKTITIPKKGNVFRCIIPYKNLDPNLPIRRLTFHLYGDQLTQHSALRSTKKYKSRHSIAL